MRERKTIIYTIKSEDRCGRLQCNAPCRGRPTNFHISQLHVNMSIQQPMQQLVSNLQQCEQCKET